MGNGNCLAIDFLITACGVIKVPCLTLEEWLKIRWMDVFFLISCRIFLHCVHYNKRLWLVLMVNCILIPSPKRNDHAKGKRRERSTVTWPCELLTDPVFGWRRPGLLLRLPLVHSFLLRRQPLPLIPEDCGGLGGHGPRDPSAPRVSSPSLGDITQHWGQSALPASLVSITSQHSVYNQCALCNIKEMESLSMTRLSQLSMPP